MSNGDTLATADIAVVGAGIAGLCTAWELRQRGFGVVVVDQRWPGYGSSGRNPGSLWLQTRRSGFELDLARAGKSKYVEYLDALGDVFDFRVDGGLFFFENERQGHVIEDFVRDRRQAGLDIQLVTRAEAIDLSPILPDTAIGAAYCADDAQIDSLNFSAAMESACIRAGAMFFRNTAVLSTLRDRDRVTGVRTVRGEIHASGVVWATGAWASTLHAEGLDVPVTTARVGQVMMQPVVTTASPLLHGPRGVYGCGGIADLTSFDAAEFAGPMVPEQSDRAFDDTVVLNRGGSLYVGHSIDGRGSLNPHISLEATRAMVDTGRARYGRFADYGVTGLWAGLASETADGLPIVDRTDGCYVNVGHEWGVASGPICGQVLAEIIADEPSALAPGLKADRAPLQPPA